MKQRTLLLIVMASFITVTHAQKKQQPVTGYAITAMEKGGRSWKEVRLVDISSGEQLKSIYQSTQDIEALNARTGKPVEKKSSQAMSKVPTKKVVNLDMELDKAGTTRIYSYTTDDKITTKIEKVNVNTNVNVDEKKIREAIQHKNITIIR